MNKHQLEVKKYLMEANCINQSIHSKLEQVQALNNLATSASTKLSDMPGSPNRNIHKMEDIIVKIVDLQTEIGNDIDQLLILKQHIMECIKQVDDKEGRFILEERYLRQAKWEEITEALGKSRRQVFRIHDDALEKIKIPESWH